MRAPVIAIVGRPNVGKSTLFNRLAGRRIAIVEDLPGVTRDRLYADCLTDIEVEGKLVDVRFTIIDTGGFEPVPSNKLFELVKEQTQLAIEEADVIIHVVDAQLGVHPDDAVVAKLLRKAGSPVIVAANKLDHVNHDPLAAELYRLGVERVVGISASHGRGIEALLLMTYSLLSDALKAGAHEAAVDDDSFAALSNDVLEQALDDALDELEGANGDDLDAESSGADPDADSEVEGDGVEQAKKPSKLLRAVPAVLRLAVIGRPNAGKSSFVNKLLGEERHLDSEMPGTTMDAVDSFVEYGGSRFRVIDTAGIRRKRSISQRVEKYAVVAALRGMDRADIVLHLIDATAGVTDQDKRIASFVEDKGKAVVLVVNKWDLAREKEMDADVYAAQVREQVSFLDHAPIRFVSAKTGKRVFDVLTTATDLAKRHFQRISTGQVNRVLNAATEAHQPPMNKGRRVRLYFATQVKTAPPTFVIATNDVEGLHFSYRRFLVNQFREAFDFGGAPVRLIFRRREGDRLANLSPAKKENRKLKREAHAGDLKAGIKKARGAPRSGAAAAAKAGAKGRSSKPPSKTPRVDKKSAKSGKAAKSKPAARAGAKKTSKRG